MPPPQVSPPGSVPGPPGQRVLTFLSHCPGSQLALAPAPAPVHVADASTDGPLTLGTKPGEWLGIDGGALEVGARTPVLWLRLRQGAPAGRHVQRAGQGWSPASSTPSPSASPAPTLSRTVTASQKGSCPLGFLGRLSTLGGLGSNLRLPGELGGHLSYTG